MLLLDQDLPVRLDVLDNRDGTIATAEAVLWSLDGEWARLRLPEPAHCSGLHWGARLRFWMGEGGSALELIGALTTSEIVAVEEFEEREEREESAGTDAPLAGMGEADADAAPLFRELTVRLLHCRPVCQRRAVVRRARRFLAHIRGAEPGNEERAEWTPVHCLDISLGGMRLQCPPLAARSGRVSVRLPLPPATSDPQTRQELCLQGRVLRVGQAIRRAGHAELAIKFEQVTPAQQSLLAAWLNG